MSRTSRPFPKPRRDGWTTERQLTFLDALVTTRTVHAAAAAAGMSRESAFRLRSRDANGLFSLLWDRIVAPVVEGRGKSHACPLSNGRLARLLGNHFRRQSGDFERIGAASQSARAIHRTGPS